MDDYQEPEQTKLTLKTSYILKRILRYLKPHAGLFVLGILMYLVTSLLSALEPTLIGWVVDELNKANVAYAEIALYGGYYAACITTNLVLTYFAGLCVQVLAQDIIQDLRQDVFNHIQTLSIDQLHSIPVGKWVTRATNDVNSIMSFFSDVLISIISNMMFLICIVVVIFIKSPLLALVDLAFLPVIAVVSAIFASTSRKHYRQVRSSISSLNAFLSEKTKEKAILKLDKIVIKMGYPDQISKLYGSLHFPKDASFFEATFALDSQNRNFRVLEMAIKPEPQPQVS